MTDEKDDITCSFCGRSQDEVDRIIAGPGVYICNECAKLCNEILSEEEISEENLDLSIGDVPKPKEIKIFLMIILYFKTMLKKLYRLPFIITTKE